MWVLFVMFTNKQFKILHIALFPSLFVLCHPAHLPTVDNQTYSVACSSGVHSTATTTVVAAIVVACKHKQHFMQRGAQISLAYKFVRPNHARLSVIKYTGSGNTDLLLTCENNLFYYKYFPQLSRTIIVWLAGGYVWLACPPGDELMLDATTFPVIIFVQNANNYNIKVQQQQHYLFNWQRFRAITLLLWIF